MVKIFEPRNSILTGVYKTRDGFSLYMGAVVFTGIFIFSVIVNPIINNQEISVGQQLLWKNISAIPLTAVCFLIMYFIVTAMHLLFMLWAFKRPKPKISFVWDMFFLPAALFLSLLLLLFPPAAAVLAGLPEVCALGLTLEQVKVFFKIYSFLRVKLKVVLARGELPPIPTVKYVLTFMIMPTLIYEDEYPRSKQVRLKRLLQHFMELVGCAVVGAYFATTIQKPMVGFRSISLDYSLAVSCILGHFTHTTVLFLAWFYAYCHAYPNLLAELTRFEDRLFYKDWWSSESPRDFFIKWNTVFQDWLFHCVYVDVRKATKSRNVATTVVFLIGMVFHEWFLFFCMGIFCPIVSIYYISTGVGMWILPVLGLTSRVMGRVVVWHGVIISLGVMIFAYVMEIYARINCPYPTDTHWFLRIFVPRMWTCSLAEELL